jgi:hypothetical protein
MKHFSKTVIAAFGLSLPIMLSSCATIVSGGNPSITINGNVRNL